MVTSNLLLVFFAGIPFSGNLETTGEFFANYHRGHSAARAAGKPLLLVLNPGPQGNGNTVSVDTIRKTQERRSLLKDYVVVVIDTTTPHGQIVHRAYAHPKLPHVVVLGKHQDYQIFTTSESLYGQRWTEILKTYRAGERIVQQRAATYCPT